jgi:nucleoside-diphosphate-sugar epimerase
MKAVITGADGFLGRALMQRLPEATGLDLADGDISRPGEWQAKVRGEVVIHTAAAVGMPRNAEHYWQVNTLGTRNVLDAAKANGVRRFVLFSSVTVFGNDFPDQVSEDYPTRPTGVPYADSKIAAEHLCLMVEDIEVVIVRPGDVYGPGSRPWTLLPLQMIRSRQVAVPTSGIHSPVYVDDVVEGVLAAAASPAAVGQIITVSGGLGVPTAQYFDRYAHMLGRRAVPRVPRVLMLAGAGLANRVGLLTDLSPAGVRYLADRRGTYSIDKAARLLGWQPKIDLDDGMARTQRWLAAEGLLGQ